MRDQAGSWMAFLAMCFAVVGLTGLFASFAAPLPLERAFARDTTLDQALAANAAPDPKAALAALAPRLAESLDAIRPAGPDLPARVARERMAMHTRFQHQADEAEIQIRMMIGIVTAMAAVFGCAILSMSRRGGPAAMSAGPPDHIRRNGEVDTSNTREV